MIPCKCGCGKDVIGSEHKKFYSEACRKRYWLRLHRSKAAESSKASKARKQKESNFDHRRDDWKARILELVNPTTHRYMGML
jgi:hypothetical protein